MDQHRIAIEERSGIWLLFHETLITAEGYYEQELIRIFRNFDTAETGAVQEKIDRQIYTPTIIRDDNLKFERYREACSNSHSTD